MAVKLVWWDGKVNPCDFDYKSMLKTGDIEIEKNDNIKRLWNSEKYNNLRKYHIEKARNKISPCNKCIMI